jgi:hypothetical protein
MAGFLYYAPGKSPIRNRTAAVALGLGYAFTSDSIEGGECMGENTPDQGSGFVFADTTRLGDKLPKIVPGEQVWRKIRGTAGYVGMYRDAPPTPDELVRPQTLKSYFVTIGDREWMVPITARFDEERELLETALPCYVVEDENGQWTNDAVLDAYRALWEVGAKFRDDYHRRYFDETAAHDFTRDELYSAAVSYLQANYVVGAAELSLMKALTNEAFIHGAILAANDLATFRQWAQQKKSTANAAATAGSASSSGATD